MIANVSEYFLMMFSRRLHRPFAPTSPITSRVKMKTRQQFVRDELILFAQFALLIYTFAKSRVSPIHETRSRVYVKIHVHVFPVATFTKKKVCLGNRLAGSALQNMYFQQRPCRYIWKARRYYFFFVPYAAVADQSEIEKVFLRTGLHAVFEANDTIHSYIFTR